MKVHPETIRLWLRKGRFPHAYRLGRRGGWRIPPGDLVAMKENVAAQSRLDREGTKKTVTGKAARRLPRTTGMVEDESFQSSESEAYMHEHTDREHVQAE